MRTVTGTLVPLESAREKQVILLSFTVKFTTFLLKVRVIVTSVGTLVLPSGTELSASPRGTFFPPPDPSPFPPSAKADTARLVIRSRIKRIERILFLFIVRLPVHTFKAIPGPPSIPAVIAAYIILGKALFLIIQSEIPAMCCLRHGKLRSRSAREKDPSVIMFFPHATVSSPCEESDAIPRRFVLRGLFSDC